MKYKVIANYNNGHKVNYTYEGDGEYNGKKETALERLHRQLTKPNITSYEIVEIIK